MSKKKPQPFEDSIPVLDKRLRCGWTSALVWVTKGEQEHFHIYGPRGPFWCRGPLSSVRRRFGAGVPDSMERLDDRRRRLDYNRNYMREWRKKRHGGEDGTD